MKMTRKEAIRLHRELWGWLAENPMKQKTDYPKFKTECVRNDCYLCEFAGSQCAKCPVEWPKPRYVSPCYCMKSYFGEWDDAKLPEERSRLAAIIRDLPEKQEVKLKPKFSVGDKVYPVSKTVPGFENNIKEDVHWQKAEPRGYFFVTDIDEYRTKSTGKTVYVCNFRKNTTTGNYFFESDLRPYVEPEKKWEPAFKVGDKVKAVKETNCWGEVKPGDIGVITKVLDGLYVADFPAQKGWLGKEECFVLATSINHCPEDKTVTVQTITIEFKGPKTICTIKNQFGTFKGRAKCHPTVHWNEKTGADLALERAVEKFNEYQPDA